MVIKSFKRRSVLAGMAGAVMVPPSVAFAQDTSGIEASWEESYLWIATTWHSLAYWSSDRFSKAADVMPEEWGLDLNSLDLFAEMGVWKALLLDASSITPPEKYELFHAYLVRKFESLERASRYYTDGIVLNDMELVRRGSSFFDDGYVLDEEFFESGFDQLLVNRSIEDDVDVLPILDTLGLESAEITPSEIVGVRGDLSEIADPMALGFSTGPTIGESLASVDIHIYSDFQCHFCRSFYFETLPFVIEDFVHTGLVRLVFHDFPRLGTDTAIADPDDLSIEINDPNNESALAAHAAMSASEQGAYMKMSTLIFNSFQDVQSGIYTPSKLSQLAGALDLDIQMFNESMESGQYLPALAASVEQGRVYGITATPMFILDNRNGDPNVIQQTAEGYSLLKRQIELAIRTAQ